MPDEGIALLGEDGLLGAFALEVEPVGWRARSCSAANARMASPWNSSRRNASTVQIAVQAQVHMTRFLSTRIPRVAGPTRPRRRPGGLRRRAWRGWADFQVRSDQAIRRHWTAGVLRVLVLLAVAAQRMVVLAGGQQGGDLDPQGFQDGRWQGRHETSV